MIEVLTCALGASTLPGCTDGRGEQVSFASSGVTADGSESGGGDGDDGDKLDVAGGQEGADDGGNTTGCEKVDFLFVVDNSGSMQDEQQQLIASFPGFIQTISETLDAQDYHVMAVSTDNGEMTGLNSMCINGVCTCTPAPVCCENACMWGSSNCNGFDCDNLPIDECDKQYGAGKTYDADGNFCNLADDRRWMTDAQPNLEPTFECIAHVGTYGSGDEKPMLALTSAVAKTMNDPGGCDEGFLRSDAILVVTFITDEEDDHSGDQGAGSPGEPADWAQAVIAAKNGDQKAAVVLGLVGDSNLQNGVCAANGDPNGGGDGAEDGIRLQQFVEMFEHGVVGSVCAADFTPFFLDAVSVIDTTCEEFVPPG